MTMDGEDGADGSHRRKRLKTTSSSNNSEKVLKFRNYVPQGDDVAPRIKKAEETAVLPSIKKTQEIADILKHDEKTAGASDVLNLAPKEVNLDLKRGVAKRMRKLDRLTNIAIRDLIKEKLSQEANENSNKDPDE